MDLSTLHVTHDIHDLDLDVIHSFLASAYWSVDIPKETVWQAIQHSLCTGLFLNGQQIGFARAITDYATFAYIADVLSWRLIAVRDCLNHYCQHYLINSII